MRPLAPHSHSHPSRACVRGPGGGREARGLSTQVRVCSRPQVSASEDGTVVKDTSVVLEIPAPTTIAYGVIELYVKLDGQFGECRLLLGLLADGARLRDRLSSLGRTLGVDP